MISVLRSRPGCSASRAAPAVAVSGVHSPRWGWVGVGAGADSGTERRTVHNGKGVQVMSGVGWRVVSQLPAVLASCGIVGAVTVLVPSRWGVVIALGWIALIGSARRPTVEHGLARLVGSARTLTELERVALAGPLTQLCAVHRGPPALQVLVIPGVGVDATGFGRGTVLVTQGLVDGLRHGGLDSAEVTALLMSAAGQIRSGITHCDGWLTAVTLPWLPGRIVTQVVARVAGWLPLVGFAWRLRAITVGIAVWQALTEGHGWAALGLTAIGVFSYLTPHAATRAARAIVLAGDQYAADHGYGPPLCRILSRYRGDEFVLERLHHLTSPSGLAVVQQTRPRRRHTPTGAGRLPGRKHPGGGLQQLGKPPQIRLAGSEPPRHLGDLARRRTAVQQRLDGVLAASQDLNDPVAGVFGDLQRAIHTDHPQRHVTQPALQPAIQVLAQIQPQQHSPHFQGRCFHPRQHLDDLPHLATVLPQTHDQ